MLEPTTGHSAREHGLEPLLCEVIPEVLGSVGSVGTWLDNVQIELSFLGVSQQLLPRPETREKIPYAIQRLRRISFRCIDFMTEQDSDNLGEFLKPYLDTPSLRALWLDLRLDSETEDSAVGRVGQVMTLRPWRKLTEILLER
jgi:hypothetical protein